MRVVLLSFGKVFHTCFSLDFVLFALTFKCFNEMINAYKRIFNTQVRRAAMKHVASMLKELKRKAFGVHIYSFNKHFTEHPTVLWARIYATKE